MLPLSNKNETTGSEEQHAIEVGTPSGRLYTKRRWTLGDSRELIEGERHEPLAVTVSWIFFPTLAAVLILVLMAGV